MQVPASVELKTVGSSLTQFGTRGVLGKNRLSGRPAHPLVPTGGLQKLRRLECAYAFFSGREVAAQAKRNPTETWPKAPKTCVAGLAQRCPTSTLTVCWAACVLAASAGN